MSATKDATDGHSRLPWKVVEHDFICSEDYTVAELTYCTQPKDERRANAQLIVTAVNERERLRELAQDFRKWLVQTNADGTEYTVWPEWVQRIDAALNETEG